MKDLRSLLRASVATLLLACPAIADENPFAAPTKPRPNFLVLLADDLTFRAIGASGHPDIQTPHIDRLARRGTMFTHAHIQGGLGGAVCIASRAMLMTGRTLWRCGPNGNCKAPDKTIYPLWPRVLSDAGYQTYGVGKWHNGPDVLNQAFQQHEHTIQSGMLESTPSGGPAYHRPAPGNPWTPDAPRWKGHWKVENERVSHSSERWADAAIEHLRQASAKKDPFLLYVAFHAPHDPRQAPRSYVDRYPLSKLFLPPNLLPKHPFDLGEFSTRDEILAPYPRTDAIVRTHLQEYYAIISHLDTQIGRILAELETSGRSDNTIIVFASDNGLAVGQHGLMGKQCLYDHSIRVPLIFAGPGIPKGTRRDDLVTIASLFATTCEMAKIPLPKTVESPSLVPLIENRIGAAPGAVFAGYMNKQRMIRTADWKLIESPVANMIQLFDIKNDVWEQKNLAGDPAHQQRIDDLHEQLKKWSLASGDPLPTGKLDQTLAEYRRKNALPSR